MKLITQSFEIISQTDFSITGILKHIERCARVSYKSEGHITDTSYKKFTDMLISRGHTRPLEFGTVHLKVEAHKLDSLILKLAYADMYHSLWLKYKVYGEYAYITTNYRYYLDICHRFSSFQGFFTDEDNEHYPVRPTVHFIISRGIMDEFRTHVGLSHLAESTRYCNYSKDKFNNEVTFIKPDWYIDGDYPKTLSWSEKEEPSAALQIALEEAEESYLFLLHVGCKPQDAREALPLGVKSELISCGFMDAWQNFFQRRCAYDAHPMAREIAKPLQSKFIELGYVNQS